ARLSETAKIPAPTKPRTTCNYPRPRSRGSPSPLKASRRHARRLRSFRRSPGWFVRDCRAHRLPLCCGPVGGFDRGLDSPRLRGCHWRGPAIQHGLCEGLKEVASFRGPRETPEGVVTATLLAVDGSAGPEAPPRCADKLPVGPT